MTQYLESYIPAVGQNGLNTLKNAIFGGTLSVTGATTLGALTVSSLVNTGSSSGSKFPLIDQTTATVTLTAAQSNTVVLMDKTDGITVTLPAPAVGLSYHFLYVVDQASSNNVIITDAGTTFVKGGINMLVVNSATSKGFVGNGTSHVKITSNATTTGGLSGGSIWARCITSTQWSLDGQLVGSGTIATPFST